MSHPPQPNRRQFFIGELHSQSESDVPVVDPQDAQPLPPLFTFSRNAMGCEFQILCPAQHQQALSAAVADGFELIETLEQQMSHYRQSSEISWINSQAYAEEQKVEDGLFRLLCSAIQLNHQTSACFDITTGPLTKLWGFHRRQASIPPQSAIDEALTYVGHKIIRLDPAKQTIRLLHPKAEINLGGIGKGYALDRLSELLLEYQVGEFMIHGGQSSVLARGHRQNLDAMPIPWKVGITHPLTPRIRFAQLELHNQSLGTSGCGRQSFVHQGKRYSHILDPRTGWPSDRVLSATVLAPTAMQADALATAMFVLGVEASEKLCARYPEFSALLIRQTNRSGQLDVVTLNIDSSQLELLA